MDIVTFNLADLPDPNDKQGRSYRQVNAARAHAIPVGTLVELDSGERLYVVMHTRDCDQTPLYSLGMRDDLESGDPLAQHRWQNGYDEDGLEIIPRDVTP